MRRKEERFVQDNSRVITRLHMPQSEERVKRIIGRVLNMSEEGVLPVLQEVLKDFSNRHKNIWEVFYRHYDQVRKHVPGNASLSDTKKALIGAYFTHEYSIQSAAFFNPSVVPHPDQNGLQEGDLRFILSFRSTGEGHISSIEFRSGVIDAKHRISFDPVSRFVETPEVITNPCYDKHTFQLKLSEMSTTNRFTEQIFEHLPDTFSYADLQDAIRYKLDVEEMTHTLYHETINKIFWLARSNYELRFRPDQQLSERVIFPVSQNELKGIEDARFVKFTDENGDATYYATYTAYSTTGILPQILETKDFLSFKMITLNGPAVQNKGMALFPRKVNGKYVMVSRLDGENMYIMSSDNLHFWNSAQLLQEPESPWEFIQIGNCGSPLETDAGWILLTHGVGPMRRYCIGALLLDHDDPSRIIGRLPQPLLSPDEIEREGYVPNVVYTCGAIIHNGELIIPYAMSDTRSGIATVCVDRLLNSLQ